ncbi:predicted protein [Streptomyces filamentosus NRRL 15998]|uniref:Predicted protein n=1 Tax=Streptomyces filamentosus NRRL 15998 TaxID=457431 RepID=D6ARK2_STRFL|nr:predicted protein [Streptomyces filamentosus NRRL 15998]
MNGYVSGAATCHEQPEQDADVRRGPRTSTDDHQGMDHEY